MGIIIEKGITPEAEQELNAYFMAYPAVEMAPGKYYLFDATDAPMFASMTENAYKGTFDPLSI